MAWSFGDGFDLYAAVADMTTGYWDSGSFASVTLVAGRFAGSQAVQWASSTNILTKSSSVNDAVHHLVLAIRQTAVLSGSTLGYYLELFDGATAQCSVVFRSDGALLLTSGGPGGTVLATYAGAISAQNTWFAFEIEVTINNTTGGIAVRKNGSTSNDFSAASLDTQNSANAYANKLSVGLQAIFSSHQVDDLFWQSSAAAGTWLGDIRCYTRMPASDATAVFSRSTGATNYSCVDEAPLNTTDYVFSATPGDADFYGIASIASTPASVVAVTTRGYMSKSDAGARTACVQMKSGGTTVASTTLTLSTSWGWTWRTDMTDPATSTAWTAAGVNAVQIGPKTIA
jgi:hypothetical protein